MTESSLLVAQPAVGGAPEPSCNAFAPAAATRLVRVEHFEPVEFVAEEARGSYLRRFTTLFLDESSERRGGVGRVLRATNARGERFALKFLSLPEGGGPGVEAVLRATFEGEFQAHQRLCGLRGFPRLYGRGRVEGTPVIVMEWIEGITLERAARQLAVDDAGRLSPLVAARIGRDLLDVLSRMELLQGGLAHRDISPRNVMVDTARLSLADQVEEGTFELRLVDFGSSAMLGEEDTGITSRFGGKRGATADYAPPEMLTEDVAAVESLRHSPAVDVYAAASVLYRLLEGRPPYDLSFAARAECGHRSAYRIKTEFAPEPVCGAHGAAADIAGVLGQEPEVAVAVGQASAALESAPSGNAVRLALTQVDAQIEPLLEAGLSPDQRRRPRASALRDALGAFCRNYAGNIGRALRGEPLAPCSLEGTDAATARRPGFGRKMARGLIGGVSAALVVSVATATGLLANGMAVALPADGSGWTGPLPGAVAAALALAPCLVGLLLRWHDRHSGFGLAKAVLGALFAATAAGALVALCGWPTAELRESLYGTLLAATVAPLPLFAADYALAPPAAPRTAGTGSGSKTAAPRRPVLPWGADPDALRPAVAGATAMPALGSAAGLVASTDSPAPSPAAAPDEPEATYEYDDPAMEGAS